MFIEHFDTSGAIFGSLAKFQFERRTPNNFGTPISSNAKEALIHVDVAAVRDGADRGWFRVRIECPGESLLRLQFVFQTLRFDSLLLKPGKLGNIFSAMDDIRDLVVRIQDGRIDRTPEP